MVKRRTLVQAFMEVVKKQPSAKALLFYDSSSKGFIGETYQVLYEKVLKLANFLSHLGINKEENITILSDNNPSWPVIDFAILGLGAVNVSKGSDATLEEITFITNYCESQKVFLENKNFLNQFLENLDQYPLVKNVFILNDEGIDWSELEGLSQNFFSLNKILEDPFTTEDKNKVEDIFMRGNGDDTYTIIFTSGTTGEPKGVVLSHYNTLWQVEESGPYIDLHEGSSALCVLPIWHSFQRLGNYCLLLRGATVVYSKPIPHIMLRDISLTNPNYLICVPRLLTAIQQGVYNNLKKGSWVSRAIFKTFFILSYWNISFRKQILNLVPEFERKTSFFIRFFSLFGYILTVPFLLIGRGLIFRPIYEKMGKNFKGFVSGGGKLPKATDRFFSVLGLSVQDSYGLTETAPGVAMRKTKGSLPGTVGEPFANKTEIELRDEEGNIVPQGQKGIVFVRGVQVMKGYYKRPDLTEQVISKDGWFNTGDLARQSRQGDLEIVGRVKDTIVLLSGKNIEPLPIEEALRESEFIENAVVLGQDQKYLGALITLSMDTLEKAVEDSKEDSLFVKAQEMLSKTSKEEKGALGNLKKGAKDLLSSHNVNLYPLKKIPKEKWFETQEVRDLIQSQIRTYVNEKNGFKDYELISSFKILPRSFEVGREISPKLDIKRHVINDIYKKEIQSLFS